MTNEAREDILIRIKKLLALSKKNENENEAAAAAAKVQELLIQYNLEQEDLASVDANKIEKLTRQFYNRHRKGVNDQRWKIELAFVVADANLCKVLHTGNKELEWFGKPSNIEVAQYLFETLCQDLEWIAEVKWNQILELRKLQAAYPDLDIFKDKSLMWTHGKNWKKSFYLGAIITIQDRLNLGLNQLSKDKNTLALIVTSGKEVEAYVKQMYPKIGSYGNIYTNLSGSGYNAGKEAGKKIQFKRGVGSGGSLGPKLLGE